MMTPCLVPSSNHHIINLIKTYHANMCLVNAKGLVDIGLLCFPFIVGGRVPKDALEEKCLGILDGIFHPCRYTVDTFTIWLGDAAFEQSAMGNWECSICVLRNHQWENAEVILLAFMTVPVPLIEVTKLHQNQYFGYLTIETSLAAGAHSLYSRSPSLLMLRPNFL